MTGEGECEACTPKSHQCADFFCGCWVAEDSSYDANIHHTRENGGESACRCPNCGPNTGKNSTERHHSLLAAKDAEIAALRAALSIELEIATRLGMPARAERLRRALEGKEKP